MASTGGRCSPRYRRIRREVIARAEAADTRCAGCGGIIDYRFSRIYPRHRLAVVVDHIRELCVGGSLEDPANLRVMHWGCNSAKSNSLRIGTRYKVKSDVPFTTVPARSRRRVTPLTSRQW